MKVAHEKEIILGKGIIQITDIDTGKIINTLKCDSFKFTVDDEKHLCELCGYLDCICSDFDIDPDMGDK